MVSLVILSLPFQENLFARIWLSRHGLCSDQYWSSWIYCMGAPHVYCRLRRWYMWGEFTWCNGFPLGHNQLWKHWGVMMGAFCECSHSKCASMMSNHLAYIMMWCNMLHKCHCACGQTTSWYKRETITIHNILIYYDVNRKYLKAMLIEH